MCSAGMQFPGLRPQVCPPRDPLLFVLDLLIDLYPTLIIAGSHNQGVPIPHANMLHDDIPGSQLVIIDGADHALIWTHTAESIRVVDEFLRS